MNKVSKSIKKYRTAKGITQGELAEKMFVSRQTVSSWENGRTQPDIDSLTQLSQALAVSIEELIYGEKPRTVDDGKNEKARKQMITVFSIIASLLVGVGGVLVFVNYWNEFPKLMKAVFAFLPMLLGQAAGVFVFTKKYDRVPWREGASVLWCAGVAATIALCDSVFMLTTDAFTCMLADMILFIPVVFILDAVAPLIAIYVLTEISGALMMEGQDFTGGEMLCNALVFFVPVILGAVYCIIHRKKTEDSRYAYAEWITVLAFLASAVLFPVENCSDFYIAPAIALFMLLYALKERDTFSAPAKVMGVLLLPASAVVTSFMFRPTDYVDYYFNIAESLTLRYCFMFLLTLICAIGSFISMLKRNKDGRSGVFFAVSSFLMFIMSYVALAESLSGKVMTYVIIFVIAMLQGVSLITLGARESRFLPLNVGLLTIIALIMEIVLSQDIDALVAGLIMIFFGVVLFVINYRLARKGKTKKEAVTDEEQ